MVGISVAESRIRKRLSWGAPGACDLLPQQIPQRVVEDSGGNRHGPWDSCSTGTSRSPRRSVPSKARTVLSTPCPLGRGPSGACQTSLTHLPRPPRALIGPAKPGPGWRCTPPIAMLLPQIRGGPGNLPGMGVEKVRPISFNSPSHLESQPWNARSSSSSPMPPSVA